MKKLLIIAVAVCAAFTFAVPAMAVDTEITGNMRVRGFSYSNPGLNADASESKAYYDMRVRLQPVFKVNDNISVTLRTDIMDTNFGAVGASDETGKIVHNFDTDADLDGVNDAYSGSFSQDTLIDINRAYMTIKSSIGKFDFGHMAGAKWGNTFGDREENYDRLKYTLPVGNLTLLGIIQKNQENDADSAGSNDEDLDAYYLAGVYNGGNYKAGLLYAYVDYNHSPYLNSGTKHALVPYFTGDFGSWNVQAEVNLVASGEFDWDNHPTYGTKTTDMGGLAFNLEVGYNADSFGAEFGYISVSGTDETDAANGDTNAANYAYGGIGYDWDKFVIFSDADGLLNGYTSSSASVAKYGVDMIYAGFKFFPKENIKVWFNVGQATKNADWTGVEDDYGIEFDANASVKIMDNLTYVVRAGYLDAGDIWQSINSVTTVDTTYTIYHKLQVDF